MPPNLSISFSLYFSGILFQEFITVDSFRMDPNKQPRKPSKPAPKPSSFAANFPISCHFLSSLATAPVKQSINAAHTGLAGDVARPSHARWRQHHGRGRLDHPVCTWTARPRSRVDRLTAARPLAGRGEPPPPIGRKLAAHPVQEQ